MSRLERHVPRLALEWAATHPDERWRRIDGTLCFADISGFTALAERLAQRGRQGGEELVQTLGTVFAEMLEIARARGGSLLKFGGDALLLFFQGDDHAVQGACAAVEMRRALRAASDRRTSVGRLRLSMSVGLHSGAMDFFLVGDSHRELVLLGHGADEVVAAEGAASAGEILLSEAMAGRLPSSAGRSREDGRSLLRWRKPAVPPRGGLASREWEPGLVASLVPGALGAHLGLGAPDPEHRIACMAFICFSGTSALLAERGGEALAQDLQTTLAGVQRALDEEGVTLLSVDPDRNGGKFFLAAGIPRAHEDDEGSMLRALKKIMDRSLPIQLQAGVSRGHVFAAELGTDERAAFSAMGDTTNTAARIASKTPPGSIYVHPSVLDECLTLYDVKPSAPLVLKGKRAPLVAYEVGAEIGLRGREGLDVEEFFGREQELAEIGRATSEMQSYAGGVLTIEADSGLGKTRLIREALGRSAVERVVAIRGEPYGTNNPYRALRDPLRDLFHIERADNDSMAAALVGFIGRNAPGSEPMAALVGNILQIAIEPSEAVLAIEDRFKGEVAANTLVDLMEQSIDGPLVLFVDDAHWLDDASAELLSRIESACASRPWLILVARRPGAGGFSSEDARRMDLGPLDDASMRALVQAATEAAPLRPHELTTLVRRAGGNPLFATEIIKAARDVGSLEDVPLSLEAAISTQIDALDSTARRILRYASVLGRSFSVPVLESLLDVEGHKLDTSALERVVGFLTEDGEGRFRFRNGVVRDAAYAGLAYRVRSRLHSAAGATMERSAEVPELVASDLALHFSQAGEHEKAWKWAVRAADAAREAYANAEAARLYELAIQSARYLPQLEEHAIVECRIELGLALERAGRENEALSALSVALKQADSDITRARILDRRAFIKENIGAYPGAQRDLRRGLRLTSATRSREGEMVRAALMSSLAQHFLVSSQAHRALKQGHIAEAAAKEANDEASRARALMVIGDASVLIDGPGEGPEIREALAIYQGLGDLRMQACAMDSLGFGCAYAGRWEEASHWLQSARDGYRRIGDEVSAAYMDMNLGIMRVNQNRTDEAERILTDCIRVMRSGEFQHGVASAEMHLARVRSAQGAYDDAISILNRVVDYFEDVGQTIQKLEALSYLAMALTDSGKADAALSLLDEAERATPQEWVMQLPTMLIAKTTALVAMGRLEEALSQAETGAAAARERHMLYEEALLNNSRIGALAALGRDSAPEEKDAVQSILLTLGVQAE